MQIAICEDNIQMQNKLHESIKDWVEARILNVDIMCFTSAESFLMTWPGKMFDLAFLDIEMKSITGIELANIIRKSDKTTQIVFITSHSQYALHGYDVNALHYLIKPVSYTKLLPILDKAYSIWKATKDTYIFVPDSSGQRKLYLGDILYVTIQSHTASIHTNEKVYEMRKTLNEIMESLTNNFIQIHRSYIVNLYNVECVFKDSLELSNDEKLPISRNNTKTVSDAFIRLHTMR